MLANAAMLSDVAKAMMLPRGVLKADAIVAAASSKIALAAWRLQKQAAIKS